MSEISTDIYFDGQRLRPLESTATIAKISGRTARGIRKMCERGDLKATKMGKVWAVNTKAFLLQFGLIDG